jgi:hypothetical protein
MAFYPLNTWRYPRPVRSCGPAWPGHQARRPMSAVRLGEKNMAMTNAASAIPQDTAKPIWDRMAFPAGVSEANVPARISPAAPMAGPACRNAMAAACLHRVHRGCGLWVIRQRHRVVGGLGGTRTKVRPGPAIGACPTPARLRHRSTAPDTRSWRLLGWPAGTLRPPRAGCSGSPPRSGASAGSKIPPDRHLRVTPCPLPLHSVQITEPDGRTVHMLGLTLGRWPGGAGRDWPSGSVRA